MDPNKHYYIKQTTNTTRTHIDTIRYKVDVNTMEHSYVPHLNLNEIGKVVFTTAKPLFFDAYRRNKSCGSFILIDPITNNTSAVGMMTGPVDSKEMLVEELPELDLRKLGIGAEHYEAVERVCKELDRLGIAVKVIK